MAEQNSIDNNSNNNNNDNSVETPTERRQRLKRQFHVPLSRVFEILREDRIRRREEKKRSRQEGSYDGDKEDDEEEYKELFTNVTKCLVKPPCGHEAWLEYMDNLATQKAAAAATSVCHDDVDAPEAGPKKKLKVDEQEALEGGHDETTSTQIDNNDSHSMHVKVWTRMLLMNKGYDPLKPQDSAKASGMDKQIKVTLG